MDRKKNRSVIPRKKTVEMESLNKTQWTRPDSKWPLEKTVEKDRWKKPLVERPLWRSVKEQPPTKNVEIIDFQTKLSCLQKYKTITNIQSLRQKNKSAKHPTKTGNQTENLWTIKFQLKCKITAKRQKQMYSSVNKLNSALELFFSSKNKSRVKMRKKSSQKDEKSHWISRKTWISVQSTIALFLALFTE